MDKLEQAIARLDRAVARLEAAGGERSEVPLPAREIDGPEVRKIAGQIAARIDDALARIARVLREGG